MQEVEAGLKHWKSVKEVAFAKKDQDPACAKKAIQWLGHTRESFTIRRIRWAAERLRALGYTLKVKELRPLTVEMRHFTISDIVRMLVEVRAESGEPWPICVKMVNARILSSSKLTGRPEVSLRSILCGGGFHDLCANQTLEDEEQELQDTMEVARLFRIPSLGVLKRQRGRWIRQLIILLAGDDFWVTNTFPLRTALERLSSDRTFRLPLRVVAEEVLDFFKKTGKWSAAVAEFNKAHNMVRHGAVLIGPRRPYGSVLCDTCGVDVAAVMRSNHAVRRV